MRHRQKTVKLGRTTSHRRALLASLVCELIAQRRIQTTLAKAKAARSLAEKMITLGKSGTLAARRRAVAKLHRKDRVSVLFDEIAPTYKDRAGGYTRILKLGRRLGDNSEMAILEWVESDGEGTSKKASHRKKKELEKNAPPAGEEKAAPKTPAESKKSEKADSEDKTKEAGK